MENAETPITPPVALMFWLHEALAAIHEEVVPFVLGRHRRLSTVTAGTQNCLAGRVVRFGVMGYIDLETVLTDLPKLEQVLGILGHRVAVGYVFIEHR